MTEDTPTRELEAPRSEVEEGAVVFDATTQRYRLYTAEDLAAIRKEILLEAIEAVLGSLEEAD